MSKVVPTHEQVRALAGTVRDGKCSPDQREQLANLLYLINTALQQAQRSARRHLAWEPVGTAYVELLASADQEQGDQPERLSSSSCAGTTVTSRRAGRW